MRHVDLDLPAARRAAATCRAASVELRARALALETALGGSGWAGGDRRRAGAMLHELALVMRRRADALVATAARIDGAVVLALALEEQRRVAARTCPTVAPATVGPPTAGPASSPPVVAGDATTEAAAGAGRSTAGVAVPVGVR